MSAIAPVLVALVWAAALLVGLRWGLALAREGLGAWERVRTPQPETRPVPVPIDVPNDLEALVLSQSELWAQEDMAKLIREKHEEYGGDWNKVRAAFGLGSLS